MDHILATYFKLHSKYVYNDLVQLGYVKGPTERLIFLPLWLFPYAMLMHHIYNESSIFALTLSNIAVHLIYNENSIFPDFSIFNMQ